MTRQDDDRPDDFERDFRRSASAPPTMSPHEAARRVRERISKASPRRAWLLLPAAAMAAVLGLLAARALHVNVPTPPPRASVEPGTPAVEPLPDNVVLWWIDPETPVYFVVAPPTHEGGPS